jgi:hypothetical protein
MANKKFTTSLTIQAEKTYDCSLSKNYTDVFSINQELDNADAFVTLVSGGSSKATNTMASAKAILLKNNSNIAAELLITVMEWKDSSDTDVYNSVDLGPGSATSFRSWSFLLPAGEFMYLPNNRVLAYASDVGTAYESAAKASDGAISTEPLSINSANEYADSTADLDHATSSDMGSDVTVVDLYMEDGHSKFFKVGDLIQVETEIMEIESLGDGSNLAKSKAVVKRGLLGSTAATHADDVAINFFFGNEHLKYNVGKCMSDKKGRFKQRGGFFSKARTSDTKVDGLVPGSVAIGPFYTEGGYLDWGLNGITANTETGLAASTTYTFHIVVDIFANDGFDSTSGEVAIAFTTDASDTTFAGSSNAVLPKIQAVLDTQSYTTSSKINGKKVKIFLHNGDVRVQSMTNNSSTIIGIGNVSGTTPFGVGAFPKSLGVGAVPGLMGSDHGGGGTDTIVYGPKSTLAQEEITDPITGVSKLNEKAFIFDNGNGDLLYLDKVVGKVDYEKGHCEWTVASLPEAEFKVRGQSNSAHSGGVTYSAQEYNSIQEIKARSINAVKDTSIEAIVLG